MQVQRGDRPRATGDLADVAMLWTLFIHRSTHRRLCIRLVEDGSQPFRRGDLLRGAVQFVRNQMDWSGNRAHPSIAGVLGVGPQHGRQLSVRQHPNKPPTRPELFEHLFHLAMHFEGFLQSHPTHRLGPLHVVQHNRLALGLEPLPVAARLALVVVAGPGTLRAVAAVVGSAEAQILPARVARVVPALKKSKLLAHDVPLVVVGTLPETNLDPLNRARVNIWV